MAASKKRSPVWEFFEEPVALEAAEKKGKADKGVHCKLCDTVLADGGGTRNLLNHLHAKHPQEYKRCSPETTQQSTHKQTLLNTGMFRKCTAQHAAAIIL